MLIDNDKYEVHFDRMNHSTILIYDGNNKLLKMIACPFTETGCDIISLDEKITQGYTTNFEGLVMFTTENRRHLFYRGRLIDTITK